VSSPVGAKGRARPSGLSVRCLVRAAGGGYVTPAPSKPKVESAYPKPGARSVLTRHLLYGGWVFLG
jgi:hypothetical protein